MKIFLVSAIAIAMFGAILLSQVLFPQQTAAQQPNDFKTARNESPFACNRLALTPEQRKRHFDELGPLVRSRKKVVRELADGFEFEFSSDLATVQLVSEWAGGEHACCPFFDIDLHLEPEGGPLRMRLTGRNGVKQFIEAEGSTWLKQ